jgi:hypothetical protein
MLSVYGVYGYRMISRIKKDLVLRRVRRIAENDFLASPHVSVCPCIRPSVRMELGPQWTDIYEILYLGVFENPLKKHTFH